MALPAGVIVIWSGAIVNIPAGWGICDGTGTRPDLRDRFIPGAGTTYNPGDSGGAVNHDHDFTGDGHHHHLEAGDDMGFAISQSDVTDDQPAVGTTDNASTLPPYYALAFIIKL